MMVLEEEATSSPEEVRPGGIQWIGIGKDNDVDSIIMEGRAGKVYDRRTDM
jgi:hypothetical protein